MNDDAYRTRICNHCQGGGTVPDPPSKTRTPNRVYSFFSFHWPRMAIVAGLSSIILLIVLVPKPKDTRPPVREATRTNLYHVVDKPNGVECWVHGKVGGLWCRPLPEAALTSTSNP